MFPTHLEIAVNAYIKRALLKKYIYRLSLSCSMYFEFNHVFSNIIIVQSYTF